MLILDLGATMHGQGRLPVSQTGQPVRAPVLCRGLWRKATCPPKPILSYSCMKSGVRASIVPGHGRTGGESRDVDSNQEAADPPERGGKWKLQGPDLAGFASSYEQRSTWFRITAVGCRKLREHLLPILLVHFLSDCSLFFLHRLCHRATNEVAVRMLTCPGLPEAVAHSPWYLVADPSIANFATGYQTLVLGIFALSFPLNVLVKAWATLTTLSLCQDDQDGVMLQLPRSFWSRIGSCLREVIQAGRAAAPSWRAVWAVELLVAAAVVPLQFASLLVVTLPLTVPLILELQTASPAALFEQKGAWQAIKRSRTLVKKIRFSLAVPFIGAVVLQRLTERIRDLILGLLPTRMFVDVVEVPVIIYVGGLLLATLLLRFQDVLPYAAYVESLQREKTEHMATTPQPTIGSTSSGEILEG